MLLIGRLRRRRSDPSAPTATAGGYYSYLIKAWLFTTVWLVAGYWTSSDSLGRWRWVAWAVLAITTPDLPTLFSTRSRYLKLVEEQARPAERKWFADVRTGDKQ